MSVSTASSRTLPALSPLPPLTGPEWARGGEARLWKDPDDERFLIKVFYDEQGVSPRPRTGAAALHLVELTSVADRLLPSEWFELVEHFAWPVGLYGPSLDQIEAIRVPLAGPSFFIDIDFTFGRENKPLDLGYLITNYLERPIVVSNSAPKPEPSDRAEIALSCARSLQMIWRQGMLYGDLSAKNILWTTGPRPRAFFLDVESCRQIGEAGVFSPDWKPAAHLDGRIEGERSLFARLVWRIFAHSRNDALPAVGVDEGDLKELRPAATAALLECHQTGSEKAFDDLITELRQLRSVENQAKLFDWAQGSGFARLLLEVAPAKPNSHQHDLLHRARRQAALETQLRTRRTASVSVAAEPGFLLDLPESPITTSRIGTSDDLRLLYESGEFQTIAGMFTSGRVGIAIDSKLTRAVRHALAEVSSPSVASSSAPGDSTIRLQWSWPAEMWVNQCVIQQLDEQGNEIASSTCQRDGRPPQAIAGPWPGGGGTLLVTFAAMDDKGRVIKGDQGTGSVTSITVPPSRRPAASKDQAASGPAIALPPKPIAPAPMRQPHDTDHFSVTAAPQQAVTPVTPATPNKPQRFWRRLLGRWKRSK